MKKKIISIICFLFIICLNCFAQNTDPKYYTDYTNDFSGYAVALYLGNLKELNDISPDDFFYKVSEKLDNDFNPIKKVTKKNNWLFKQALKEWEYEKNEVYVVCCADSKYSDDALVFFVVINGKDDFKWVAYNFNESDFDRIAEIMNEEEPNDIEINDVEVTPIPSAEEYVSGQREILEWYTSLGLIEAKTNDSNPATVLVSIALGYKKDDKATLEEIKRREVELKAFLRRYFSGKKASELRDVNKEDALENEIKNGINDKILSSSRIRDVVFQQKDVIGGY